MKIAPTSGGLSISCSKPFHFCYVNRLILGGQERCICGGQQVLAVLQFLLGSHPLSHCPHLSVSVSILSALVQQASDSYISVSIGFLVGVHSPPLRSPSWYICSTTPWANTTSTCVTISHRATSHETQGPAPTVAHAPKLQGRRPANEHSQRAVPEYPIPQILRMG